jgi:uncharacterized protein DUF3617
MLERAMTEIARRQANPNPIQRPVLRALAAVCALLATISAVFAYDGPVLRGGLWKFERTIETNGKSSDLLQISGFARETTRCINPSRVLRFELTSGLGFCPAQKVRKTDDTYVFQKVCRGTSPIRTEINVQGDSDYTEINEGKTGKIAAKETLVAHRVGDCRPPS